MIIQIKEYRAKNREATKKEYDKQHKLVYDIQNLEKERKSMKTIKEAPEEELDEHDLLK